MNVCFFIGNVIKVEKFKFILNGKHKSKISINLKLLDGNIINVIAYDEIADYILRNNFDRCTVFIQGKLTSKLYTIIYYIEKISGEAKLENEK